MKTLTKAERLAAIDEVEREWAAMGDDRLVETQQDWNW